LSVIRIHPLDSGAAEGGMAAIQGMSVLIMLISRIQLKQVCLQTERLAPQLER